MERDQHQNKRETIHLLEALAQAIDRRVEIFAAVETSETDEEAITAIGKVLDVGRLRANAVLDMQARRWTRAGRRRITEQIELLRSELEATS